MSKGVDYVRCFPCNGHCRQDLRKGNYDSFARFVKEESLQLRKFIVPEWLLLLKKHFNIMGVRFL